MGSLAGPWVHQPKEEGRFAGGRYTVEFRAYLAKGGNHSLRRRQNERRSKEKVKRNRRNQNNKQDRNKTLEEIAPSHKVIEPIQRSYERWPADDLLRSQEIKPMLPDLSTYTSKTIQLQQPSDGLQLSRDALLEFQVNNRAEPVRKLLETSGKLQLKDTPFRYNLASKTSGADPGRRSVEQEESDRVCDVTEDDVISNQRSDGDLPGQEYCTPCGLSSEDNMKHSSSSSRSGGVLPVIDISGQLPKLAVQTEGGLVGRRLAGHTGYRPPRLTIYPETGLTPRERAQTQEGYISGRPIGENNTDKRVARHALPRAGTFIRGTGTNFSSHNYRLDESRPDPRAHNYRLDESRPDPRPHNHRLDESRSDPRAHNHRLDESRPVPRPPATDRRKPEKHLHSESSTNGLLNESQDHFSSENSLEIKPPPLERTKNTAKEKPSSFVGTSSSVQTLPSISQARCRVDCHSLPPTRRTQSLSRGSLSLPAVAEDDRKGTSRSLQHQPLHYNQLGNTSKLSRPKSYSLKDLTELHRERKEVTHQSRSQVFQVPDPAWKTRMENNQRVIESSSYDMFARKATKKRSYNLNNTSKVMNLYQGKPVSPPTTARDDESVDSDDVSVGGHEEYVQSLVGDVAVHTVEDVASDNYSEWQEHVQSRSSMTS